MKVSEVNQIVLDAADTINYHFEASPNSRPGLTPQQIIVYATMRKDVVSQVSAFKTGPNSAHLIIGKDSREIVQMVDFNRLSVQNSVFDKTSLAVTLDHPGYLLENVSVNDFRSIKRYDPSQVVFALPAKGSKIRPWPLYPKTQLDAFLAVARLLFEKYETLLSLLANDEVRLGVVDPGPTFPRTLFREQLLGGRGTLDTLQETTQEVLLRLGPGAQHRSLHPDPLPASTQVTVSNTQDGWAFIEALAELEGNPWLVGWVEERFVRARTYIPVVIDNLLLTTDGRRYPFIPAGEGNFETRPKMEPPKYIVMHGTTGTQMSSTINTFKNVGTGVSTHLLVGRDGRVVQFLPFDTIGHHAGLSFWEGERSLNRMSIGIELDNAQFLRKVGDQWFRKKTVIPPENVVEIAHWKESRTRGWETFTQGQLDTALAIVKALVEHYHIEDILGHDIINLINRLDPGPLFPIEDWREQIYGRRDPNIKPFVLTKATPIFENHLGEPPVAQHPRFSGQLPERSKVKILDTQGVWVLVKVLETSKASFSNTTGWLKKAALKKRRGFSVTTAAKEMFEKLPGASSPPPPTEKKGSPLPANTRVRIQEVRGTLTLVLVLDLPRKNIKWMEGWVETDALQPLPTV